MKFGGKPATIRTITPSEIVCTTPDNTGTQPVTLHYKEEKASVGDFKFAQVSDERV